MTPAIMETETYTEDAIHAAKVVLYIEGCLVLAIMVMAFAVFSFDGSTIPQAVTTDISATLFKRD